MALKIESAERPSIISSASGDANRKQRARPLSSRARLPVFIILCLSFAASGFAQSGDRQLADSKQPYFQSFSPAVRHHT